MLEIHALLEAGIDFLDDVQDDLHTEKMVAQLDRGVLQKIEKLLNDYEQNHFYRDGVKMAIVGRPNVGKSSLMNCLIQRDRGHRHRSARDYPGCY